MFSECSLALMFPRNNCSLTKGSKGGTIKIHCVRTSSALLLVKTAFLCDLGTRNNNVVLQSSCFLNRFGQLCDSLRSVLKWEMYLCFSSLQEQLKNKEIKRVSSGNAILFLFIDYSLPRCTLPCVDTMLYMENLFHMPQACIKYISFDICMKCEIAV